MPNSIGEVSVQVTADFAAFIVKARAAGKAAGEQAEAGFEGGFNPEGEGTTRKFWSGVDRDNRRQSRRSGEDSGKSWANSFTKMVGLQIRAAAARFGLIFASLATVAEPAIAGLYGIAAAGTALASSGLYAAAGALLPLPAILSALGLGAVVAAIGFQGLGTAVGDLSSALRSGIPEDIEAANAALAKLGPSTEAFGKALANANVAFDETRLKIREGLFAGLDEEVRRLSESVLPGLETAFIDTAGIINRTFREISDTLIKYDFGGIIQGLVPVFDTLASAVPNLLGAFLSFLRATTPGAQRLADLFLGWTERLEEFMAKAAEDGRIADFVDAGIDSFEKWASLIKSTGVLLLNLAEQGKTFGDDLVVSLDNMLARWGANEEGMQRFFEAGEQVVAALKPIFEGLGQAIGILTSPESIDRFSALASQIGEAIPKVAELIAAFAETGALVVFVDFVNLILDLANLLAPLVVKVLQFKTALYQIIVDFFQLVVGIFTDFGAFWDALWADIISVGETALEWFNGFVGAMQVVADLIGAAFLALAGALSAIWGGIVSTVSSAVSQLSAIVTAAWDFIYTRVSAVVSALARFISGVWDGITERVSDVVEGIIELWDSVVSFFEGLPGAFGDALDTIVDVISAPFEAAYNTVKGWIDKIKNLPGTIAGGVGSFLGSINPFARGGVVFGPTQALIGEAGPEAVIPLNRPLSQIDPAVRRMAQLLREGGQARGGGTSNVSNSSRSNVINNTFNIQDATGSAEATATKVMNRMARL